MRCWWQCTEFPVVASSIDLYSPLKAAFACRCGICSINPTWQITSSEPRSDVPLPDTNLRVLGDQDFCMYFDFLCLFVLIPSLSSAFLVIFFYLVCLILKFFRLCVVFPSGLDVNSSLLAYLTRSFLLLASYRIALGLHGKVLVAGRAAGVASARSCWKLPPCLIEPMPAGSTMDLPLAKAEPISDGGSASGIT